MENQSQPGPYTSDEHNQWYKEHYPKGGRPPTGKGEPVFVYLQREDYELLRTLAKEKEKSPGKTAQGILKRSLRRRYSQTEEEAI